MTVVSDWKPALVAVLVVLAAGTGYIVGHDRSSSPTDVSAEPTYSYSIDEPVCEISTGRGYWAGKDLPDKYWLVKNDTRIPVGNETACRELADTVMVWTE